MNDKKIAFIICVNDELYCKECLYYIEQLYIPAGYETDIICITEAGSMAEAYNAAMESSDARYKVYLHQDVFIYHRDFVGDILKLFQTNERLGLLGMIGGVNLPQDAVIWNAWNRGSVFACDNKDIYTVLRYNRESDDEYVEVEAVDGMLMATQYDIKWREDLNLGWDFYDISQSLEFRRKGYRVGIPFQDSPWCMHDCGYSKLAGYDTSREKILDEYTEFFTGRYELFYDDEPRQLEERIFYQMKKSIEQGEFGQAVQIKEMIGDNKIRSNNLQYALNLTDIYLEEKKASVNGSFFDGISAFEEMKERYNKIKFLIWHMENRTNSPETEKLASMIREKKISQEAVWSIAEHCAVEKEKVCISLFGCETAKKMMETFQAKNEREWFAAMNQKLNYILIQIEKMPGQKGLALLYNNLWVITSYLDAVSKMSGGMQELYSSVFMEKAEALCAKRVSSEELEKYRDEYNWLLEKLIKLTEDAEKFI